MKKVIAGMDQVKPVIKHARKVQVEDINGNMMEIENPYVSIPDLCADTINDIQTYDLKDLKGYGEDNYTIIVDTIISDNYGPDGPTVVLQGLGLIPETDVDAAEAPSERDTEFDAEAMEDVFNAIADDINEQKTIPGQFTASWNDGGFYLMFVFDDDDAAKMGIQPELPFKGSIITLEAKVIEGPKKKVAAKLQVLWEDTQDFEVRISGNPVAGEPAVMHDSNGEGYPGSAPVIEDMRVEIFVGDDGWLDITDRLSSEEIDHFMNLAIDAWESASKDNPTGDDREL